MSIYLLCHVIDGKSSREVKKDRQLEDRLEEKSECEKSSKEEIDELD